MAAINVARGECIVRHRWLRVELMQQLRDELDMGSLDDDLLPRLVCRKTPGCNRHSHLRQLEADVLRLHEWDGGRVFTPHPDRRFEDFSRGLLGELDLVRIPGPD